MSLLLLPSSSSSSPRLIITATGSTIENAAPRLVITATGSAIEIAEAGSADFCSRIVVSQTD
jgi:hypothetical protein